MRPEPVVFLGPSLPHATAAALLHADYRPPIKRGDLVKLLADPPQVVGIIDGEFFQGLSVSPKEILPLMEAGISVLGASSMGALRAVENHPYGMIGVGRIFRMFLRGEIDADDEVAVTYSPETFRTTSEPLVNVRLALRDARGRGVIDAASSSRLIRRMKAVYFPERTRTRFWREAESVLAPENLAALREFFREHEPDAKAEDAKALLHCIARGLDTGRYTEPGFVESQDEPNPHSEGSSKSRAASQ